MNALIIQRNAQIGGGNTYLRAVAPELRRRGHDLHLMIGPGPCRSLLQDAFGHPLVLRPPVPALASHILARVIKKRDIAVVNAHTYKTAQVALPACQRAGVPLIQHVHSLIPLDKAAEVLQAAARVVVMNRSVLEWVAQVDGLAEKTVLSVLPVDPDRFYPRPLRADEGFRIVYCGRLGRRKAAYVFQILDVLDDIAAEIPTVELVVVGGRSRWRQVARQAATANARLGRNAVTVLGQLLDPSDVIASADLVIGTGYVALEALACGRHVIGVGIQGLTGLVTPENLPACVNANFGDHAAIDRHVTPEKFKRGILAAHEVWRESPSAAWGADVIRREFTPKRVADDLEVVWREAADVGGAIGR